MKRLTELETLTNGLNSMSIVKVENQTQANQKLFVLEGIEEELGIDLVTLFKALHNGVYILTRDDGIELRYVRSVDLWSVFVISKENPLFSHYDTLYYFKDYGKTWALTKEELENDK